MADRVLVDTNVAIYLAKGNEWASRFTYAVEGKVLAMAFATAGELLLTSRRSSAPEKTLRHWRERFKYFVILQPDLETVEVWADITAKLKNVGLTRQDNDLWIAACAVRYDLPLATNNAKDFSGIENLKILGPSPSAS